MPASSGSVAEAQPILCIQTVGQSLELHLEST